MHDHSKLIKECLRSPQYFTPWIMSTSTLCSSPGTTMGKRQVNKISRVLGTESPWF